ncbi:rhomboid family intramembrane serine protease [Wenzhouxiangella sediminis]|uniref:Rhomboid family intramembrane serine protease n=1 Tax=Wenzhouxiangella sediminis TaxID=1792836 RepID=A0A3E1K9Q6_9GAMM|nr:rhomboid family intramembrane serine protease [Wenzhouxiangella sediminis]RFF30945.1 rhomboid family intramembrane serine protease [Wenzhouxiangella sediminis]
MIDSGGMRRRRLAWPWVLTVFSLIMLVTWVYAEWRLGDGAGEWIRSWGFVPARVLAALDHLPGSWNSRDLLAVLTSLFVHGDWLHLAGNLAYLWVFGTTVERALGHAGLALSFLVLGALANLILAWQLGTTQTPVIGASGGVSALIGIYLGLFPVSRMGLWLPLGLYLQFARVPAILVIGSWFTLQLIYTVFGGQDGAVAWWAHIAGFVAGVVVAILLRPFPGLVDLTLQDD